MLELNRDNYDAEVLGAQQVVLVDFWGPQCRPCLALMPAVEEMERDFSGKLKVTKVNAVQNRMLCARLRVMGLPCFLLYKGGVEVKRLTGEQITKECLKKAIEELTI